MNIKIKFKITFFPFPIWRHDVIRHIKNITNEFFKNNYLKCFKKAFKIITIFGILKSPWHNNLKSHSIDSMDL
jgi:hypothetical protein